MHTLQGRGGYWGGWAGEDAEGQEEDNEGQEEDAEGQEEDAEGQEEDAEGRGEDRGAGEDSTHPHDDAHPFALIGEGEDLQDGEIQDLVARGPQLHGGLVSAHQGQSHAFCPLDQGHLEEMECGTSDTLHMNAEKEEMEAEGAVWQAQKQPHTTGVWQRP